MNAPELAMHAASQMIPLACITPSPTNPRKHFDPVALDELTVSVRKHGVIQPVLVRAGTSPKDKRVIWELVAGERRYRAAKAAGLEEIPAIVRSLTDAEALELQVIENLQREDLHPLEEAEGYELLLKRHGYTAEDLAGKIGKSKAYVYARFKLAALTPKGRAAFYAGKLNASTALLIARIPVPALQEKALAEITAVDYQGEPEFSVRDAAHYLQEHYMLRLADAPFPPADDKLLPKAGSCAACPKRTGNQPELFGDVKGADVCTDPECFDAKKAAHLARARATAEAKGQTVITGKAAKKIVPYGRVSEGSGFIGLDEKNYSDPKQRSFRQILGKACPTPTLVESEAGKLIEVVARKEVGELLQDKLPPQRSGNDDQKKREARARLETSIRAALFDAIITAHTGIMTPADGTLIAGELYQRTDHECTKRILKRWEPAAFAAAKDEVWKLKKTFAARIATLSPPELVRLMIELALSGEIHVGSWSTPGKPELLNATAERFGVDHAKIRAQLTAAAKAKASPKAKTVKKSRSAKPQRQRAAA